MGAAPCRCTSSQLPSQCLSRATSDCRCGAVGQIGTQQAKQQCLLIALEARQSAGRPHSYAATASCQPATLHPTCPARQSQSSPAMPACPHVVANQLDCGLGPPFLNPQLLAGRRRTRGSRCCRRRCTSRRPSSSAAAIKGAGGGASGSSRRLLLLLHPLLHLARLLLLLHGIGRRHCHLRKLEEVRQ